MASTGIPIRWRAATCALALAAAAGCGVGPSAPQPSGPPRPTDPGTPTGGRAALKVGPDGGFVTSSDGMLTVSVPAGALATEIDITIEVITNTAPSPVGNAYRIATVPPGVALGAQIALVFTLPPDAPPIAEVSLAIQDANGYWVRQQSVIRDPVEGTITVNTTTLGDWAMVGLPTGRDLIGIYHVESTMNVPVVADGKSGLNFYSGDLTTGSYIHFGEITARSPMTASGLTCAPAAATQPLAPNVAEILAAPDRFQWAFDAFWELSCGPTVTDFAYVNFDTAGINYVSLDCTRTYLQPPLVTPEKLLGSYRIDCGTQGAVSASWQFEICNLGEPCPSSNPCHTASITCDTGLPLCVDDGNVPNGTSCDLVVGVNEVCGDGVCNVCRIGETCTPVGNVCHVGTYTCDTGFEVCTDTGAFIPNGTTCDVDPTQPEVCGNGTCNLCTAGKACATNPNPCVAGTTSCTTGFETCVDTTTPIAPGTACNVDPLVDEVCNGTGTCIACSAGLACATNANECVAGVTSCHTGAQTCENTTTPIANGTACDDVPLVPEVCFNGVCSACTAGLACATNPNRCVQGVTSCATGQELCVDTTTPIPNGTTCDVDPLQPEVCNNGVCNACAAGLDCTTQPNPCVNGVTSCATGVQTCENGTILDPNGTSCGTNLVCNAGTCVSCTAGLACATNPNRCVQGVTSCATGTQACVDTATWIPNGTACDVDPLQPEVCNGGVCSVCAAGVACTTNPDPLCHDGLTSCTTGTSVCLDDTVKPNGTACGTNLVCSAGTCVSCTAGLACTTNPDPCLTGITSCSTGSQVCVDNAAAPEPNGTSCGANLVCNAGACTSCTAGLACTTNPDPLCNVGVTSCSTGTSVCVDGASRPNGTACGTDQVCNAGTCTSCTAGLACATNPDPCLAGVTSCATGTQTCVDDPLAPEPNGTACGTNLVCNGGLCTSCTAGLACTTNPDPLCNVGVTSCSTGTSTCVDGANRTDGTACGTNLVCSAGTCVSCTAGLACATNPNPCVAGTTSCASGAQTCVDTATPIPNGTACDVDPLQPEVCNGGVCSVCAPGVACTTNPDPLCNVGVTSCSTGTSVCVDGADRPNGTVCGAGLVCNAGTCTACTAGLACTTNPDPCLTGITSCSTGSQVCVDNAAAPEPNGTSCGANLVCNAGACTSCTAGLACTTNPDPLCNVGVTSCSTGTSVCVDGASRPNGTACGTDQVCNAGTCTSCTAGLACATNPDPCLTGITSCSTGSQVCVDDATAPEPNGTSCGTNLVCRAGVCSACTAGVACTTNSNPCVNGVTSCATGLQTCENGTLPDPDGTSCGTNLVCSAGVCTSCVAGGACTTNPDPLCNVGVTSCSTGTSVCVDGANRPNGTSCGADLVCSAGTCTPCTAGLACDGNPSQCLLGITSCTTGTSVCVDSAVAKDDGTACDVDPLVDEVCSGGVCGTCAEGLACTTNPDPLCHVGITSCTTGTQTCVDGAARPAGTSCGTDLVCSSAGACVACTDGAACSTNSNPCVNGVTSCATGAQTCENGTNLDPDGTACGTNLVCSAGACTPCTAGLACGTNPDPCLGGVTSCSTGAQTCVDDPGAPEPNGTTCGTNLVCNAGVCATCTAGLACATNPDPCLVGVTSCTTGTQACVDDPLAPEPDGTACGTDQTCSGGVCAACVAGLACTGNPTACLAGVTSCATGTSVCVDSATALANGTTCDVDPLVSEVCSAGACTPCTAGLSCTGNPDPLCNVGVTSCATGRETCVDGANRTDGTSCGTNLVCIAGACTSCTAGLACTTNPNPCVNGVTSCTTGVQTCVDGSVPDPNGTSCGTNLVCNAGTCTSCTAGVACTTNPDPLCNVGVTSCATGTSVCVDGADRPNGTTCGTNQVCSAGTCTSCTAGLACTTNPDPLCHAGVTSCSTGVQTCVDGAARPAGTSCGTNLVCSSAGACTSCTAGLACTTNPDPCLAGVTSCASGAQTCVDDALAPEPDGTACGVDRVCSGGVCTACVAGLACTGNPGACLAGVTSCATGTSVCVDSTTVLANGTTCDVDPLVSEVCSAGACTPCTAGLACATNPDPCRTGITSCATGDQVCVDNSDPLTYEPNGTACGTSLVCYAGACTACTAGLACTTNPNPCVNGVTSCTTGVQTCVNGTVPDPNGTSCGTNLVCNAGACVSCTAGLACSTNPDPCLTGITSCSTGTQTCVDAAAAPEPDGTNCGTNMVCRAGVCTTCTAGLACNTNPDPCLTGVTSCTTGAQTCVNTSTAAPNGTTCDVVPGVSEVCNGGVCTACSSGLSCATNPNPCVAGTTSCTTGTQVCIDTATRLANGTSCGTNMVCSAGVCTSCTAGLACDTNPAPCLAGTTSCATGAQTCVDGAPEPDGTACDVNAAVPEVCSAGTCVACTAGEACTPSNPCHVGTTSCATGPACTDTGATLPDGTSCGAGLSCSLGTCVPSRTVTGTRMASYWTTGAGCTAAAPCRSTVVAPDVVGLTAHVEALVPDGAGGWIRYAGTFSLDGSFAIPAVPAGAYRLVLYGGDGVVHVVDTTSSSVDLGYDVLGRSDAALATLPTPVTFQLTGLTNWLSGDEVQATAFDADVWDAPASGADVVTNQTTGTVVEDWSASSLGRALNLLSPGDALHVHQLATATVTVGSGRSRVSYAYQRATVARTLSGYALSDGQPATLPVALAAVTSTGSITVDWQPEQFEALLPQLGPSAVAAPNAHRVLVETAPYASIAAAPVGLHGGPQLYRLVRSAGGPTVTLARITLPAATYGRFLDPALAAEWWRADYTALVDYTAPGATAALSVPATVGRRGRMTSPLPAPIVPAIGPVQAPTVNGQPALGAIAPLGTTTPTLAWTAPATGAPTRYEVRIHRLRAASGATVAEPVVALRLLATSVVVPAGLLVPGETYYAEITPYVVTSDAFATAPLRLGQVYSHATTLTSPFTP